MNRRSIRMLRKSILFLTYAMLFFMASTMAQSSDISTERSLQKNFQKSRVLLIKIERALASGESYHNHLEQLRELGESIRKDHQLLLKEFNTRGMQLDVLGIIIVSRHADVQERYAYIIPRYFSVLDGVNNSISMAEIHQLKEILNEIQPNRKHRIHGSTPYRHLNLPARVPKTSPEVIPAYRGGNQSFAGADLTSSPEAPISLPIAELAESLHWNPVEMYEWVKSNIETEWYWGVMKGAEETLRQKSGNDADQATLLVALFRSAEFPARYVRGVMKFFPDIGSAQKQTGLDDPLDIGRLFQKAGIPYEPIIAGGRISNFRIEHIWIEVEIPYDNYRGVVIDEHGKTWLPLDTSIKAAGYVANTPADDLQSLDLSEIRESYLSSVKSETPLEYLAAQINDQLAESSPGISYNDLLLNRTIKSEYMQIIPAGLQFTEVAITGEYASLPDELIHKARFIATAGDGTLFFDQSLPVHSLSNRSIAASFEPETIEDQEIMNAYGGLDNTPLYLIHLRPILTVDGSREIVGQGGLAAGSDFNLAVELIAPSATGQIDNVLTAGYPAVIGLSAQHAIIPDAISLYEKNAERLLYERAMAYIDLGNRTEEELTALLQVSIARPLPTLVTLGGVLDVVYLLDSAHGYDWKGVYLDADLRGVEAVGGIGSAEIDPSSLFMELASLQNSFLEHRVFEDGFGVDSLSTAKLFGLAAEENISVVTIDSANIETELPQLFFPDAISHDIANAVNQGYVVSTPTTEILYEDWIGYAYIKENPETFESGWMLSGGIAGAMTALNPGRWPENYYDILANPMVESTGDPSSAIEIKVIKGLDILAGTAGQESNSPLQIVALDHAGKRVKGVEVHFTVKAGGAQIKADGGDFQSSVMVTTGRNGIAAVDILFNQSTNINPATIWRIDDKAQRVDETVIAVTTTTGLETAAPVSVYGFPDVAHHLRVDGNGSVGPVLSWGGTLVAYVEDQYNNPRNKENVDFVMGDVQKTPCSSANNDTRQGLLVSVSDPCMNSIPVYGDCENASSAVADVTGLHIGAVAHVILGGFPDADYPITVMSDSVPSDVVVTVSSNSTGVCDEEDAPYSALALKVIHATDSFGNSIDGGPISTDENITTIPLYARIYFVREMGEAVDKEFRCSLSEIDICPVDTGKGEFYTDTNFVSASVKFDETEAVHVGNGLFRVGYPLSKLAKKHEISVTAKATATIKMTDDVCSEQNDCQLIDFDKESPLVTHDTGVFAVGVTIAQEKHVIPVNENGYASYDYPVDYTIEPPEYIAGTAYSVLSKKVASGAFEEVAYFNSKTSGEDRMTFLSGFRFDHDTSYRAQVILNKGSDYMEVKSKEIELIPLSLELDADLNSDGIFSEDDPQESIAPGFVIPLNLDDDDNDGIADLADDVIAEFDANNNLIPVHDDDLMEVKLNAIPAEFSEGTITLEILQGAEMVKIWTDQSKNTDNLLIDGPATPLAASRSWVLGTDITDLSELPKSLYIEGVSSSQNKDDSIILVTKYQSTTDPVQEVETDKLLVVVLPTAIVPDYNRDGVINDLDRDIMTDDKPWRFWVNDDDDKDSDPVTGLTMDGIISRPDDLPGQNEDNGDDQINGIRDLIDFFPLYFDIGDVLEFWPLSGGYEYVVKGVADNGSDIPGLAMVEGMAGTYVLSADSASNYLENPNVAIEFASSQVKPLVADGVKLSAGFLSQIKSSERNGIILVEGRNPWSGQLTMEIGKNGTILHSVSLPLEIVEVEEMFGHRNLRAVAGADDETPDRYVDIDPQTQKLVVGGNQEIGKQPYCMQGEDKSLVWMHGYSVSPQAARATLAEVFKRFFHAGLTGRFFGVSWFGDPPDGSISPKPHYHQSVVNAFATAGAYANFISSLPGATSIAAHSLGNVVVGSAIQDEGLTQFTSYFAIDAAVALEAYGQIVDVSSMVNSDGSFSADPNVDMIRVDSWPDYIAAEQSRLLASEWYKLFDASDNRSQLTWRNRLDQVPSDKIYNFYSSTEDVLRRYAGDNLVFDGNDWSLDALTVSTWVKQEKFKGRRHILNLADNIAGVSSSFGGWKLNPSWWVENPESVTDPKEIMPLPPELAFTVTDAQLWFEPFFELRVDELVSNDPNDPSPSDFVKKKVSETSLSYYYDDNEMAHELVEVRDWLLAEAFPATTLPMGANRNDLLESNNINMSDVRNENGGCCKTSEALWPRAYTYIENNRDWKHSDYKNVPYQHTFSFYKKVKVLSE